jgi:hypothetical protein
MNIYKNLYAKIVKKMDKLEFKNEKGQTCWVVRFGKRDYCYYINGILEKSIRAIRPYSLIMAMRGFCDSLLYEAGLGYLYEEI